MCERERGKKKIRPDHVRAHAQRRSAALLFSLLSTYKATFSQSSRVIDDVERDRCTSSKESLKKTECVRGRTKRYQASSLTRVPHLRLAPTVPFLPRFARLGSKWGVILELFFKTSFATQYFGGLVLDCIEANVCN